MAILFSSDTCFQLQVMELDPAGHFIFLKGALDTFKIIFASVYVLNLNQILFLKDVYTRPELFREGELLIAGD